MLIVFDTFSFVELNDLGPPKRGYLVAMIVSDHSPKGISLHLKMKPALITQSLKLELRHGDSK